MSTKSAFINTSHYVHEAELTAEGYDNQVSVTFGDGRPGGRAMHLILGEDSAKELAEKILGALEAVKSND